MLDAERALIRLRRRRDAAAAIEQAGNAAALFDHRESAAAADRSSTSACRRTLRVASRTRLDQQAVGRSGRVRDRSHVADRVLDVVGGLLRTRGGGVTARRTGSANAGRRRSSTCSSALACHVSRRLTLFSFAALNGRLRGVGHVGPFRDVAGVLVLEQPADVVVLPREPGGGVEPEHVLLQRPAEARVDVAIAISRCWACQAARDEHRIAVAALQRELRRWRTASLSTGCCRFSGSC